MDYEKYLENLSKHCYSSDSELPRFIISEYFLKGKNINDFKNDITEAYKNWTSEDIDDEIFESLVEDLEKYVYNPVNNAMQEKYAQMIQDNIVSIEEDFERDDILNIYMTCGKTQIYKKDIEYYGITKRTIAEYLAKRNDF